MDGRRRAPDEGGADDVRTWLLASRKCDVDDVERGMDASRVIGDDDIDCRVPVIVVVVLLLLVVV